MKTHAMSGAYTLSLWTSKLGRVMRDGGPAYQGRNGARGAADDDVQRGGSLEPERIDNDVVNVAAQGKIRRQRIDVPIQHRER